jgi:hypothetical protein
MYLSYFLHFQCFSKELKLINLLLTHLIFNVLILKSLVNIFLSQH